MKPVVYFGVVKRCQLGISEKGWKINMENEKKSCKLMCEVQYCKAVYICVDKLCDCAD
jgi:hypothetical protein